MSAKTKIIVVYAKELILAGILTVLGLVLLLVLILLLAPKKETTAQAKAPCHRPGIYKSELTLGGKTVELETILEQDRIASIRLVNLDEAVTTAYPLLEPTLDAIAGQLCQTQSLESVTTQSGAKYTSLVLLEAIEECLEKGKP